MFARDDTFSGAGEEAVGAPIDALGAAIGTCQLELLRQIATMPTEHDWESWGARDGAHWLAMRMGLSYWKASRLIRGACGLQELPQLTEALGSGRLGLEKVLELARFATPEEEAELISWAESQAPVAIREEGERRARQSAEEIHAIEQTRSVHWWYAEGQFGLEASLPAAQGATVARALERVAQTIPQMPGEEGAVFSEQRRADALVALCSGRLASDPDPDRATVVLHARLEDLRQGGAGSEIEGGGVANPLSVKRLLCDARVQVVAEDRSGNVLGVSPMRREPPAWMLRQVRYRDKGCRFPGCDARRYTQAHHIRFWSQGGRTELENLVLICGFHHRLVHELRWRVKRGPDGTIRWFWPDGRPHRRGRSPDEEERRELGRHLARYHLPPRRPELRVDPAPTASLHPPARRALMFSRT